MFTQFNEFFISVFTCYSQAARFDQRLPARKTRKLRENNRKLIIQKSSLIPFRGGSERATAGVDVWYRQIQNIWLYA